MMISAEAKRIGKLGVFWALLAVLAGCSLFKPQIPEDRSGENDQPLIYKDTLESDKRVAKVKKPKRKVFYGIKTRKAFTRVRKRKQTTIETFFTLKVYEDPNPYVPSTYWWHTKKRKLFVGPIGPKEKPFARLLHGPYKRTLNGKTQLQGIFYKGNKHGRWEEYRKEGEEEILWRKDKFYKGWPKDAKIAWYDQDQTRPREVEPLVDGRMDGDYFLFYESGLPRMSGRYEFGKRIGVWKEWYDSRGKMRQVWKYPDDAWTEGDSLLLTTYAPDGSVIYDREEEEKKNKKKVKQPSGR